MRIRYNILLVHFADFFLDNVLDVVQGSFSPGVVYCQMTKLVFIIWIDLDSCEFYSSVFSQFNTEDFIFVSIFLDSGFVLVKEEVKESTTLIFYKFDYAFHTITTAR